MTSAAAEIYDPLHAAHPVRIVSAEPVGTSVLRVAFDDGATRDVDLSETVARSRWFHTLAEPATFADMAIILDVRVTRHRDHRGNIGLPPRSQSGGRVLQHRLGKADRRAHRSPGSSENITMSMRRPSVSDQERSTPSRRNPACSAAGLGGRVVHKRRQLQAAEAPLAQRPRGQHPHGRGVHAAGDDLGHLAVVRVHPQADAAAGGAAGALDHLQRQPVAAWHGPRAQLDHVVAHATGSGGVTGIGAGTAARSYTSPVCTLSACPT